MWLLMFCLLDSCCSTVTVSLLTLHLRMCQPRSMLLTPNIALLLLPSCSQCMLRLSLAPTARLSATVTC
jgi:hypothetical protein